MEIEILSRGISLTESQLEFIERRIRFAMDRFSEQTGTVRITLSDINGPKGGNDVLVRMQMRLHRSGDVVVGDTGDSVEAIVSGITDRAARSVARLLERQRDHQGMSMSGPTNPR